MRIRYSNANKWWLVIKKKEDAEWFTGRGTMWVCLQGYHRKWDKTPSKAKGCSQKDYEYNKSEN